MTYPWEENKEQKPVEQPAPEPKKENNSIVLSQSLIKRLIDKNQEDVPCCPFQIFKNYLAKEKIPAFASLPMRYGNYGEQIILGRMAKDEEISLPQKQKGGKPIDQIRIETQAMELFPIHQAYHGINIIKNVNVQVPIYKRYGDFIIRGVIDIFPTTIFYDNTIQLAVCDLKFTGDVNNTHGDYCWGKPEWMDHIQADLYSWILSDIDVNLCKQMDKEFDVRVGYDNIFTPPVLRMLRDKNFIFLYLVLGYQKNDLKNQFIIVERKFWKHPDWQMKEKELVERIRKSIARLGYLNSTKWKPEPEFDRCKNCSVSKLFGGPCDYYSNTKSV